MSYFRFQAGDTGIYEAVERDCPRSDPRRAQKPDGSWLPRVGRKFPGAISFWTRQGLERYLHSGLQEWHRSVVREPLRVLQAEEIGQPLYQDELQLICPAGRARCTNVSWEAFASSRPGYPLVEKVVAYILRTRGTRAELLVFRHDKSWSEAGLQVPAGSVDPGESVETALSREAREESGLTDLTILRKLDEYVLFRNTHRQFNRRHVFLMETGDARETWTHSVSGGGVDRGLSFHYRWMSLPEAETGLAASLGVSVRRIAAGP